MYAYSIGHKIHNEKDIPLKPSVDFLGPAWYNLVVNNVPKHVHTAYAGLALVLAYGLFGLALIPFFPVGGHTSPTGSLCSTNRTFVPLVPLTEYYQKY